MNAILGIPGLIASAGFCGTAARLVARKFPVESGAARLLVGLVLFCAIQSLLVLVAGLGHFLSRWPLTVGCAVGWLLLRSLPFERIELRLRPSGPLDWAVLGMGAAGAVGLVVKALLLVPYTGDALMYHLPKIAEWIRAGRFVWDINHDPRNWFSAGFELIEAWWVVFLHHDLLMGFAGLQMAAMAAVAVYVLAERLGAAPGFATVLYAFVPVVLLHVTSCGNDLAVAALVLSSYALIGVRAPRAMQILPALLAVGVKATGAFAAAGLLLYAAWSDRPPKASWKWAAGVLGCGVALASVWYLRNWLVAGHPLYPFHGSHGEFTWSPQQATVDAEALQSTVQALPRRLLDRYPYESLAPNAAGWGWAVLPLGLPATVVGLKEEVRLRRLALSFLVGWAVTLACVWDDGQNLRFALWFPALFVLALARQNGRAWWVAGLLACGLNFVSTAIPYEYRYSKHIQVPETIGKDVPVACVFDGVAPAYRLYNRDFSRHVTYPRSMEALRASGAKVVYLYSVPDWAKPIQQWPSLGGKYRAIP